MKKGAANHEDAKKWLREELPGLLAAFDPKDIFNRAETALFYHGLPDKGFVPVN